MNTKNRPAFRWLFIVGHLGIVMLMLACMGIGVGSSSGKQETAHLDNGAVEVLDENGVWIPVAGDATFELVGELENTDPWTVAGRTLETNDLTQIADGLDVGDVVRVQGAILEDDIWLAYTIELAEEQTDPIVVLIGIVDSIDPWVVNGIELNVTVETVITGDITPGMIVRVEILLLPDGTWEALGISLLGDSTETPGCVTVIATILSVDGNQIQFLGWSTTLTLSDETENDQNESDDEDENGDDDEGEDDDESEDEDENEDEDNDDEEGDGEIIQPGQVVLAIVCITEDGQMVIVQVILLDQDDDDDIDDGSGNEKALVCHNASKNNPHTISIAQPAVPAHLAHGDTLGPCP